MDPEERIELARVAWEAYNAGDIEGVLRILDPDVVVHVPVELANSGTYRGHDGYRRGFGGWVEAFDHLSVDEFELEPVGDRHVVVDARQSGRGRGSGIEVEMRLGYMFELRDGKVVRFHVLHGRDAAIAAAKAG